MECEEKFNTTTKCTTRYAGRVYMVIIIFAFFSCQVCGSYDASVDSPSLTHDKGATVTAVYTEVDRK